MLVFFGAGQVSEKLIKDGLRPSFILDNNPDLNGTHFRDIPVYLPTAKLIVGISAIVICTTSVIEVEQQLDEMGYRGEVEIAKVLSEQWLVKNIFETKLSCYISSGLPSISETSGGGVYKITEDDGVQIEKVYSGNTHGLILYEDGLAFTAQGEGIVILDKNEVVDRCLQLPTGLRPHGIQVYGDNFGVACSSADKILLVGRNGDILNEYHLSSLYRHTGSPQHHCNDLYVDGHNVYVSMFSVSGNWKNGIFDGGIIRINLETGDRTVICNHLKMPHSINCIDGVFHILNSYTGEILGYDFAALGCLTGFARGLMYATATITPVKVGTGTSAN